MNQTALTLASAAVTGMVFSKRYPFPESDALLQLILDGNPYVFHTLRWSWTAMLFTTPALTFSGIFSLVFISPRVITGRDAAGWPPVPWRNRLSLYTS